MIYVGFKNPIYLPETLWIFGSETLAWIAFLFTYGFIASILPVWLLLQPRDFVNSHKLIVALAIIYLGIFVAQPAMDAPSFNMHTENVLPWFPFLFITIACGAISGFHSLVSSGTTSKQIEKIKDTRMIGYGAMLGEGSLAIAATLAVAAGFPSADAWHAHYDDFKMASGMEASLQAFVDGTASFLNELGITQVFIDAKGNEQSLAAVFISVVIISFAATSLDTATRIQRYIVGEFGESLNIKILATNRYLQSLIAVLLSFGLVMSDGGGSGGLILWPLFGATNQMVGALALLVISVWLFRLNINYWVTLIPMIFVTIITFVGTVYNIIDYVDSARWLLVIIAAVIGICQVWIISEAILVFQRERKVVKLR